MARVRDYTRINKFVQHAIDIANDDSHGYSQYHRWGPDYDCSSLMYECAYYAGYPVSKEDPRYTGAMIEDFTAVGYRCDEYDGNLYDLEKGDILLNSQYHTAVYIGDGKIVEASIDEYGGIAGKNYGDQTGHEIHIRSVYNYPWTHVLTPPEDYKEDSKPTPAPSSSKLYGIDVSSHQPGNICSIVPNDFAIVKMSGNPQSYAWDYVNPKAGQQAGEAFKRHGCVGLYHFTWGKDANTEADFFIGKVRELGYIGKAVLVIDYEGEAINLGRNWIKKFADRIKSKTNVTPVIYASGSVVISQNLFGLGYPIWVANYSRGYDRINGYDDGSCKIYGGCEGSKLWQFTSSGYLDGYNGALDLDVFYGSKTDWQNLAAIGGKKEDKVNRKGTIYEYHGGGNQRFGIKHNDDGTVTLIDQKYGLALDVNGEPKGTTKVNFVKPNGTDYQKWKLVEKKNMTNPSSVSPFVLASKLNEKLVLDADSSKNGANGTRLQLWNDLSKTNKNQLWNIEDNLDGTWTIRSVAWPKQVIDAGELL